MKKIVIYISVIFVLLFAATPISMAHTPTRITNTSFNTCFGGANDIDGDAICDSWEKNDGSLVVDFPTGPTPPTTYSYLPGQCGAGFPHDPHCINSPTPTDRQKDIFLEIDCFSGQCPSDTALTDVINSFYQQSPHIRLHIQLDETGLLPADHASSSGTTRFPGSSSNPGFDQIKAGHFGTPSERTHVNWSANEWKQKQQVFHYALFVSKQFGNEGSSGISEVFGNDIMISLGSFTGGVGSTAQQEGTLLHELGHNLNLQHGGSNNMNCKPNYLSVMSYSRQMGDLVPTRDLDYSRAALGPKTGGTPDMIFESTVVESQGVESYSAFQMSPDNDSDVEEQITWGPTTPAGLAWTGSSSVDWNGTPTGGGSYPQDLNNLSGCGSTSATDQLGGYWDWNNIKLNFKDDSDAADGVSITNPETNTLCSVDNPESDSFSESDDCIRELEGGANIDGLVRSPGGSFEITDGVYHMKIKYDGEEKTKDNVLDDREYRYKELKTEVTDKASSYPGLGTTLATEFDRQNPRDNEDFYKIIRGINKIENTMDKSEPAGRANDDCLNDAEAQDLLPGVQSVKQTFQLAANFTPTSEHPAKFGGMSTPRGQEFLGVPSDKVVCNDGFKLVLNGIDDRPACIISGAHFDDFSSTPWATNLVDICHTPPR